MQGLRSCAFVILLCRMLVVAQPRVFLPQDQLRHPAVVEGEVEHIEFLIKLVSTGDEPLKIRSTKAGCGCTSLAFDSTIAPGDTGTLIAVVDIAGKGTAFRSHVEIHTNATNRPALRVDLHARIEPALEIGFPPKQNPEKPYRLYLRTRRKRLRVRKVVFTPEDTSAADTGPVKLGDVTLHRPVGADPFGYYEYPMDIEARDIDLFRVNGRFEITTNHPARPVIHFP